MFHGEMHDNIIKRKDKNNFGPRPVIGILCLPEESRRPSEGQKNPKKLAEGQKDLAKAQTFFVIPDDEKCRGLTYELHFSTCSMFFRLQKVNFPELKIPLG